MSEYKRKYHEYILVAILCLLIGSLISAKFINFKVRKIAILNMESLQENLKFGYNLDEIENNGVKLREVKEETGEKIYKILPFMAEKIIIKNNCLLYSDGYLMHDITNKVINKIHTK